jgi:hypothetical protein
MRTRQPPKMSAAPTIRRTTPNLSRHGLSNERTETPPTTGDDVLAPKQGSAAGASPPPAMSHASGAVTGPRDARRHRLGGEPPTATRELGSGGGAELLYSDARSD